MRLLATNSQGKITGWYCTVNKLYNDLLTVQCNYCNEIRPINLEQISIETALERQGITLSDDKDLFVKLFNQERVLVKDLDIVALRSRKAELEEIITQAKIRRIAVETEERERTAKMKASNREWLTTDHSPDSRVIDSNSTLNAIKERKKRMSKADKTADLLKNKLGLDLDEVNNLMARVDRVQTSSSVNSSTTRQLIDKRPPIVNAPTSVNTKESLLADLSSSLVNGIKDRPIDDLVKAAVTAGNLANKILGDHPDKPTKANPFNFLKK